MAWSVPEFADLNGVSESKIWAEISEGELETIKVGDRTLITSAQGEHWHRRKAAAAKTARTKRARARDARQLELLGE
jgi:hypothetical protein